MVLISDISPGPSYFLMMHTPWNDFDPTNIERNLTLSRRNAESPKREKPARHKKGMNKQIRSQSLQTMSTQPEPEPKVDGNSSHGDNVATEKYAKIHPKVLCRSMSEIPVNECLKMAYEAPTLPELIGGGPHDILSDPKVSKYLVPKLESCLPYRYRHKNWKLGFSLAQHGASLHTMFRRVRGCEATLVIAETEDGEIFGGFATAPWSSSGLYYGTGEAFVFTCAGKFEFFPWARKNSLIMFSDENTIAMGGGGGFAWALNHDMSQGTSAPTMTFDNRCLTSRCNFGVVNFEVWEFVCKYQ